LSLTFQARHNLRKVLGKCLELESVDALLLLFLLFLFRNSGLPAEFRHFEGILCGPELGNDDLHGWFWGATHGALSDAHWILEGTSWAAVYHRDFLLGLLYSFGSLLFLDLLFALFISRGLVFLRCGC
jgi:hypothetical protein